MEELQNFRDATLVSRRGLPTKEFEGLDVIVADGYNLDYTRVILGLSVTLGNYTFTSDFYVIDLADIDMVLGVQWLCSLGKHTMDYQTLEMEFKAPNGSKVVMRGVTKGGPQVVFARRMEPYLDTKI